MKTKKGGGGCREKGGGAKLGGNWLKLLLCYSAIEVEKANEVKLKDKEGLKKMKSKLKLYE